MIPITIVFLICVFFEKSDYHLKKEADKLPSFTKKEAEVVVEIEEKTIAEKQLSKKKKDK